ncbi:MAG TPA: SDR family oxidoreductase [Tepidisphaeraceae bacterium]|nr:SDR family oxidoreductase [Tepidisphaeraceae bacterium]
MNRFADKIVVITGGNKGIGLACSRAFAAEGAKVISIARSDQAEVAREIGPNFQAMQFDFAIADAEQINGLVRTILENHPRIDVLVNNAGIIRRSPAVDHSEDDWREVLQVNLTAPFFLTQSVARWWIQRAAAQAPEPLRLKIVNIASLLSFQGGITVPAYTASKHGIAGITRALANEWASQRININAVAPGYIATDNTQALRDNPSRNKAIVERIPQGHWGEPAEIAGTVLFLASADSDYVNGAILNVDGGWLGR